jgi:long-chain acyl-CoA synthetase
MNSNIDTLPKLLRLNAQRYANRVALREKDFGIWQAITWSEYLDRVQQFALGLHQLGFQRGDRVVILGDNRPEWVISELAAQSLGGAITGIYQDSVVSEVTYIIQLINAKFIVAEDQEQVDKLIDIWEEIQGVQKVIYYDPKGLRDYQQDFLMAFPEVEALGRDFRAKNPNFWDQEVDKGGPDDVAVISTTSGTTSKPKLAEMMHHNFVEMGKRLTSIDRFGADDEFVSFLPMAWIGEQMMSLACGMNVGFALSFPEDTNTVQENIREIGPRIIFAPPRIWENMLSTVQVKIEDTSRLKRALYNWAMGVGYRAADAKFSKQALGPWDQVQLRLARLLVFNNLLDQLGMRYVKWAYTAGAALGPDIFRFFHALGVNLKQGYGQTETTGICVVHRDEDIKFQTVGQPMTDVEVRIEPETGEILVKGPVTLKQYYNNPEATASTLTEGWVHTGDAGYFDEDGHLIVIDRAKDVMTLQDGTKFSPQFIENKLKFSLYIKEAVVFGGGDYSFVTAFINIDFGNVGKWAENHKITYTTYTDLASRPQIYKLILEDVRRTNADLPASARIQRFLLLHKELDADDAELTRTRKVRRGYVAQTYAPLIEGLYGTRDQVDVKSVITYQDGRTATLELTLPIETVTA